MLCRRNSTCGWFDWRFGGPTRSPLCACSSRSWAFFRSGPWRSTSCPPSTSRSSSSCGTTPACRRRTWKGASPYLSERAMSTSVSGISRIESQTIAGNAILRVYFEPGSDIGGAIAQISSVSATVTRVMPPGTQPPVVLRYNASNVPVAQMTLEGQRPDRATALRLRAQLPSLAPLHDSRPCHARALRWQAAADHGRRRSDSRGGARRLTARHRRCGAAPERHLARRRRAARRHRLRRSCQRKPGRRR